MKENFDRTLICLGDGLVHGVLGLIVGGGVTLIVGVALESIGLVPTSIEQGSIVEIIEDGGIVGGLIGLIIGLGKRWQSTS